jgi:hypothetical protein
MRLCPFAAGEKHNDAIGATEPNGIARRLEGPTPKRLLRLQRLIEVSARTLARWGRWWRQSVAASRSFAVARGSFATGIVGEALPLLLLEAFPGLVEATERVVAVLRWLPPLSSGSAATTAR